MPGTVGKTINFRVQDENAGLREFRETATEDLVGVGSLVDDRTHKVGSASHEAITFPDITTKGHIAYENLSDVTIQIGLEVAATFYPFGDIPAGGIGTLPGGTAAWFAKAASGTDKELRLFVVEA
jgi:hypothetical protein